jgi:hypothetical protein
MAVDKILFGAYNPYRGALTEKKVKILADAGIDIAMVSASDNEEEFKNNLALFSKYGIKVIVTDRRTIKIYKKLIRGYAGVFDSDKASFIESYSDCEAYYGSEFVDEPGLVYFEEIGQAVREFKEKFPDKLYYVNLSPSHVTNIQYTAGPNIFDIGDVDVSENNFQKYLDEFIRLVPVDYLCLDIYPFKLKTFWDSYLNEMEIIAHTLRKADREFWLCVQSAAWLEEVHIPTEPEFRWQMYTTLAFGVVCNMMYTFTGPDVDPDVPPPKDKALLRGTPVTGEGTKHELYFAIQKITREFHAISDVFLQYRYAGVMTINCTEDTPYLKIDRTLDCYAPILDISTDKPFLLSCFEKKEGEGSAFVLVAMENFRREPAASEIKIKLAADTVTAYYDGAPLVLTPDSNGYYSFILKHCDGVFVTLS